MAKTPAIVRAALEFRASLLRGDADARRQILGVYLSAYNNIKPEFDFVTQAIEAQIRAGKTPTQAMIFEQARLQRVLAGITQEITIAAGKTADIVTKQQEAAVRQAVGDAKVLSELAADPSLPWPPPDGATGPTWTNINKPAVQSLIGHAGDGSPLRELLVSVAGDSADRARDMIAAHFTQGNTPQQIAHGLQEVFGLDMARAQATARTETMRAYRTATQETFKENDDVIEKWRWIAQLSYSTCIACISKHGQEFPLTTPMDSHVNCRCIQVPVTKTFKELGADGVEETDTSVQTGKDWFNEQTEEVQRKILGPGKYDAWREGKISIDDMVEHSHSDRWGGAYHEASLIKALKNAKKSGGGKSLIESSPRVSDFVLNNMRDEVADRADDAMLAIEKVHQPIDFGKNKPYIKRIYDSKKHGAFSKNSETREVEWFGVNPEAYMPEMAFTHEYGHGVHVKLFHGQLNERGFTELDSPGLSGLKNALDKSDSIRRIKQELEDGGIKVSIGGKAEVIKHSKEDKDLLEYYLRDQEQFARAYSQYIAVRSKNPRMLDQIKTTRSLPGVDRLSLWDDEEFAPIAREFDIIFNKKGLSL